MDDDVDIYDEALSYIYRLITKYNESPLLIVSYIKKDAVETKEK